MNEQKSFWRNEVASSYLESIDEFDSKLSVESWNQMLKGLKRSKIFSCLECGSSIERNLNLLSLLIPDSKINFIELSPEALDIANKRFKIKEIFRVPLRNARKTILMRFWTYRDAQCQFVKMIRDQESLSSRNSSASKPKLWLVQEFL